jgi:hypothetical protein
MTPISEAIGKTIIGDAVFAASRSEKADPSGGTDMPFVSRHRLTLLIALLMFLVGLGLSISEWKEFAHKLGDALMIAGLIIAVVDIAFKESLVRDVAKHVFTWEMPQEARDAVIGLLKPTIIKRNNILKCKLICEADHVVLDIEDNYDLYNCTLKSLEYKPKLEFDNHENPDRESISLWLQQSGQEAIQLNNADVIEHVKVAGGITSYQYHRKAIRLQPSDRASCRVVWKFRLKLPLTYSYIQSAGITTIGKEFRFEYDESKLCFGFEGECDHAKGSKVWTFSRVYFYGQYARMWWRPVEPATS